MASVWKLGQGIDYRDQTKNQRDIQTQAVISITLGVIAFTSFCVSHHAVRYDGGS